VEEPCGQVLVGDGSTKSGRKVGRPGTLHRKERVEPNENVMETERKAGSEEPAATWCHWVTLMKTNPMRLAGTLGVGNLDGNDETQAIRRGISVENRATRDA